VLEYLCGTVETEFDVLRHTGSTKYITVPFDKEHVKHYIFLCHMSPTSQVRNQE